MTNDFTKNQRGSIATQKGGNSTIYDSQKMLDDVTDLNASMPDLGINSMKNSNMGMQKGELSRFASMAHLSKSESKRLTQIKSYGQVNQDYFFKRKPTDPT
jgi:hypothetical protein